MPNFHQTSFYSWQNKNDIICRISIAGSDEEFSIAQKVHIDHWGIDIKRVRTAANAKANPQIIWRKLNITD